MGYRFVKLGFFMFLFGVFLFCFGSDYEDLYECVKYFSMLVNKFC